MRLVRLRRDMRRHTGAVKRSKQDGNEPTNPPAAPAPARTAVPRPRCGWCTGLHRLWPIPPPAAPVRLGTKPQAARLRLEQDAEVKGRAICERRSRWNAARAAAQEVRWSSSRSRSAKCQNFPTMRLLTNDNAQDAPLCRRMRYHMLSRSFRSA